MESQRLANEGEVFNYLCHLKVLLQNQIATITAGVQNALLLIDKPQEKKAYPLFEKLLEGMKLFKEQYSKELLEMLNGNNENEQYEINPSQSLAKQSFLALLQEGFSQIQELPPIFRYKCDTLRTFTVRLLACLLLPELRYAGDESVTETDTGKDWCVFLDEYDIRAERPYPVEYIGKPEYLSKTDGFIFSVLSKHFNVNLRWLHYHKCNGDWFDGGYEDENALPDGPIEASKVSYDNISELYWIYPRNQGSRLLEAFDSWRTETGNFNDSGYDAISYPAYWVFRVNFGEKMSHDVFQAVMSELRLIDVKFWQDPPVVYLKNIITSDEADRILTTPIELKESSVYDADNQITHVSKKVRFSKEGTSEDWYDLLAPMMKKHGYHISKRATIRLIQYEPEGYFDKHHDQPITDEIVDENGEKKEMVFNLTGLIYLTNNFSSGATTLISRLKDSSIYAVKGDMLIFECWTKHKGDECEEQKALLSMKLCKLKD